ncbi:hypothetical protein L3X38_032373 [Prunus dulcis]|uniref:Uncharacterized protein n=1 Tax=Prunus dulcis TaxID=3755 RepID=A0AAD4YVV4_PRUDU|nr:hypothetical protein L3X38_032373 [Prunus dulcis]
MEENDTWQRLTPFLRSTPSSMVLGIEEYSNISASLEVIDEDEVVELESDGIKIESNGDDEIAMDNRIDVKEKNTRAEGWNAV